MFLSSVAKVVFPGKGKIAKIYKCQWTVFVDKNMPSPVKKRKKQQNKNKQTNKTPQSHHIRSSFLDHFTCQVLALTKKLCECTLNSDESHFQRLSSSSATVSQSSLSLFTCLCASLSLAPPPGQSLPSIHLSVRWSVPSSQPAIHPSFLSFFFVSLTHFFSLP